MSRQRNKAAGRDRGDEAPATRPSDEGRELRRDDLSRQAGGGDEASRPRLDDLSQQTAKRRTLNLLIQGSAAHSFLTAHHLVADELEAIRPGLVRLYDRFIVSAHLNYWQGDLPLLFGFPSRFWRRAHRPGHPFFGHRLLTEHGGELARGSKQFLLDRAKAKRVTTIPGIHYFHVLGLFMRVLWAERRAHAALERLARRAAAQIWDIDEDRLDAQLTANVAFGNLRTPKTIKGKLVRGAVIGYGGVERREGRFHVVAKGRCFPILVHELCKGAAELVCLHGLSTLDDQIYEEVTAEADQLEHETWYLQAGAEAWRRLLRVLPSDRPVSEMLMHVARLQPDELEELMMAVMEGRPAAPDMLDSLDPPSLHERGPD